jgi:pre-60S factor REI1
VYNIKRRIASLPPIPVEVYRRQVEHKTKPVAETGLEASSGNSDNLDNNVTDDEGEEDTSPFQCLLCGQEYPSDSDGLASNVKHMRAAHGLFVPDPERIIDMESFIGYLATEVREWHECLYCGATKPSTASVQSHMRDKGHCLLNFDREPELLEFWGEGDEDAEGGGRELEGPTNLSPTEMRFSSGKVVESRHASQTTKRAARKPTPVAEPRAPSLLTGPEEAESSAAAEHGQQQQQQLMAGGQLARREQMGIVGVSVQQRQALVLAEKKAQRSEATAFRAREWIRARAANSQKFDQLDNQMKMGKQNHKLLPR